MGGDESFEELVRRERTTQHGAEAADAQRRAQAEASAAAMNASIARANDEELRLAQLRRQVQRELHLTAKALAHTRRDFEVEVKWIGSPNMGGQAASGVKRIRAWDLGDGFALGKARKHFRRSVVLYRYSYTTTVRHGAAEPVASGEESPLELRLGSAANRISHLEGIRTLLARAVARAT